MNKPRKETSVERIHRVMWEHGGDKEKPTHLNNKNILTWEDWEKSQELKRPIPFTNDNPDSYLSNQKETVNNWDKAFKSAQNPQTKKDYDTARKVKEVLKSDFKDPQKRKSFSKEEMQLVIGNEVAAPKKFDISNLSSFLNTRKRLYETVPVPRIIEPKLRRTTQGLASFLNIKKI